MKQYEKIRCLVDVTAAASEVVIQEVTSPI